MRTVEVVNIADLQLGDRVILFGGCPECPRETEETMAADLDIAAIPGYFLEDVWAGPDAVYTGAPGPLEPLAYRVKETP